LIKTYFSRWCKSEHKKSQLASRQSKGEQGIWQRRFREHQIGNEIDFTKYVEYIHFNYEIEIQLGSTDESHIIRTIEYWDIERKRYPQYDHTAVIIAEDITPFLKYNWSIQWDDSLDRHSNECSQSWR